MKWEILVVFAISILFISSFNESYQGTADVPDRPTDVLADDVGPTTVDLSWNAPDDDGGADITGYRIQYRILPSTTYLTLDDDTENTSTFYSHTNAPTNKDLAYRIAAINSQGVSEFSAESNLVEPTSSSTPPENIVPNEPLNLVALDIAPDEIELTWTKPATNNGPPVTGYKIQVKTGSGSFQNLIADTQSGSTEYIHTGRTTGTTYTYRVSAINSVGVGNPSNEDSATPTSSSAPTVSQIIPNTPTGVKVSPLSPTTLKITWREPTDNGGPAVTGYKIEFKKGEDDYEVLSENLGNSKSYQHSGLAESVAYTYRVYAINSVGTSGPSAPATGTPKHTEVPTNVEAIAVSPSSIQLTWDPPSQTYGQSVGGYIIKQKLGPGVFTDVHQTSGPTTSYTVTGLTLNKQYTYIVGARVGYAVLDSEEVSATPTATSSPPSTDTVPGVPTGLNAEATSPVQIDLTWSAPSSDGGSPITGYRIDVKVDSGGWSTLEDDTKSIVTAYSHPGRNTDTTYTYRISAINSVGIGGASNEDSATPTTESAPAEPDTKPTKPIGLKATVYSPTQITLSWSPPSDDGGQPVTGYKIEYKVGTGTFKELTPNTGRSTSYSHTGLITGTSYSYKVYAINSVGTSVASNEASATPIEEEPVVEEPKENVPDFVDPEKGAQHYLDRYNNEASYKEWFDATYPAYTIEEAIELAIPGSFPDKEGRVPDFVDPEKGAQYYIDRYNNEPAYKSWFDKNFPDYTIEEAIELAIPGAFEPEPVQEGVCGEGTKWVDGKCVLDATSGGGGCLIATAAYGSELAPQVQQLRELRDNSLLQTESGSSFMAGFNQFYYTFSPAIADAERNNPVLREAVKTGITPMIASLAILEHVDLSSEESVLGYGIGIILLNLGMYFGAPIFAIWWIKNRFSESK